MKMRIKENQGSSVPVALVHNLFMSCGVEIKLWAIDGDNVLYNGSVSSLYASHTSSIYMLKPR